MLKVLHGLKQFEGKAKFKTWLYSITYNECITQYRKDKRKRRLYDALSRILRKKRRSRSSLQWTARGLITGWYTSIRWTGKYWCLLVAELEFQEISDIMNMGPQCYQDAIQARLEN